jgi:putative transposase
MPRQLRIQYSGAIYHVMSRGDRREEIYRSDLDRVEFLKTLARCCEKTGWLIQAYCLMDNHFHLVLLTPQPNLVMGMKWLLGTYTIRYNARHRLRGHVFAGRYKSIIVDDRDEAYLRTACDYVHLNPSRAHLISEGMNLESYRWSSYAEYLLPVDQRPEWLQVDKLLSAHGVSDTGQGRAEFSQQVEKLRGVVMDGAERLLRGWKFGAEDWLDCLEKRRSPEEMSTESHLAVERRESDEVRALKLLQEALANVDLSPEMLKSLPKGDARKVEIARMLRAQTTMTLKWIAKELMMGSWTSVSNRLGALSKVRTDP